jgi:hypothetical protein
LPNSHGRLAVDARQKWAAAGQREYNLKARLCCRLAAGATTRQSFRQFLVAGKHDAPAARAGIGFGHIRGDDKVLRVEMSGFAPEPASLSFTASGEASG